MYYEFEVIRNDSGERQGFTINCLRGVSFNDAIDNCKEMLSSKYCTPLGFAVKGRVVSKTKGKSKWFRCSKTDII